MLSPILLLALLLLVLGGWFFMDSLRVREIAITLSKQACARNSLQYLDDTVALAHIALRRDGRGHLRINRTYQFEFSDSGNNRRSGYAVMQGNVLAVLHMDLPDVNAMSTEYLH